MRPKSPWILAAVFALACWILGAVFALAAFSQTTPKPLHHWEYKTIIFDPLGMPLTDALNIEGRYGWEYLEVVERDSTGKRRLLLRREIP